MTCSINNKSVQPREQWVKGSGVVDGKGTSKYNIFRQKAEKIDYKLERVK